MNYQISRVVQSDFPEITDLHVAVYGYQKEHNTLNEELIWVFSDPYLEDSFNGFIARDSTFRVVGVIGYTINEYQFRNRRFKGVIPNSWMIHPTVRGILGVQLLIEVMKLGDFGFAIEGSYQAKQTYGAAKLRLITEATTYTKVLNTISYIKSEESNTYRHWLKAFYYKSISLSTVGKANSIMLSSYCENPGTLVSPVTDLTVVPTVQREKWLIKCPIIESLIYSVYYKGEMVGNCILYLEYKAKGTRRGRVVSIPFLGDDITAYGHLIKLVEDILKKMGCCSVSVLGMQKSFVKSLKSLGYKSTKGSSKAIYVRDTKNLLSKVPLSNWHITYYESDKGYRGI